MNCYCVHLHWLGKGLRCLPLNCSSLIPSPVFSLTRQQQELPAIPGISYPNGPKLSGETCKAVKYEPCKVATEHMVWRVSDRVPSPRSCTTLGRLLSFSEPQYAISQKGWLWGIKLGKKCKLSWFSLGFPPSLLFCRLGFISFFWSPKFGKSHWVEEATRAQQQHLTGSNLYFMGSWSLWNLRSPL